MSKCPNCGGELTYDVGATKVVCPYCKGEFNPIELETKEKYASSRDTFEGRSFNCRECGAQLMTFDETAITFCSYCGSQNVIESKMVKINNPDYVIPFKITKDECIKIYKNHLKNSLFVPKYMKEDVTVEKFRGIFMPYAIYTTSFHGKSSNTGEVYSHHMGNYDYYDKYTIHAYVDAEYEGVSYDLLSKFYDKYSMSIPFDFNGIEKFNKNYLISYYADTKDVDSQLYDREAENVTSSNSTKYLIKRREFSKYGCHNPKVGLKVTSRKIGMFPVYFLAVKDKKGDLHYAIVNGQTGKIAADLPIDFTKFIIGTLLLTLLVFVLLQFGTVILPKTVLIFSLIASIISMIISITQSKKIVQRENNHDDIGVLSTKNETEESSTNIANKNKKIKFKNIYKQVIGVVIALLVLLSGTIMDEAYYFSSFVIFILILLSFNDLIKEHNILSTNKPPQLEKRGGDENGK